MISDARLSDPFEYTVTIYSVIRALGDETLQPIVFKRKSHEKGSDSEDLKHHLDVILWFEQNSSKYRIEKMIYRAVNVGLYCKILRERRTVSRKVSEYHKEDMEEMMRDFMTVFRKHSWFDELWISLFYANAEDEENDDFLCAVNCKNFWVDANNSRK